MMPAAMMFATAWRLFATSSNAARMHCARSGTGQQLDRDFGNYREQPFRAREEREQS